MTASHSSLVVTPVKTDADIQQACEILIEAADWLTSTGRALWNRDSFTPEKVRLSPEIGSLYLAHLAAQPVGVYLLQFEDPIYWPDVPTGHALYLHRLAIRRSFAGTGLAGALLEHALAQTRSAGRQFLRLDCAIRPKLCAVYESAGFRHHSDRNMGTFSIRRFERPTEYPQNSSDPAA